MASRLAQVTPGLGVYKKAADRLHFQRGKEAIHSPDRITSEVKNALFIRKKQVISVYAKFFKFWMLLYAKPVPGEPGLYRSDGNRIAAPAERQGFEGYLRKQFLHQLKEKV